ncbi:MAG: TauD/TfdA family dioxygenase, partial [bacterium]|nr:TauD/TfdA family dioxygenase [bacterium]
VITHPFSGRRGLYVNPVFTTHIEQLSPDESGAILAMLYDHCRQPEFQCRVRWRAGDITIWDNRATWHKAVNDYHGYRRLMHRVTVEGVALGAALAA